MKTGSLRNLILLLLAGTGIFSTMAVTPEEMEEARTITAQTYLRYANNYSDYLESFKAKTMSELQGKLKAKEKENLKDFNSVTVPSDYASWDKAKLVEFWSVTFFKSPNLKEEAKGARVKVKKLITAMSVSDPQAQKVAPAETSVMPETPAETPVETPVADAASEQPRAEKAIAEQEQILEDQMELAEEENTAAPRHRDNNTWLYLLILGILVAAVIVLVVFAARTIKDKKTGEVSGDAAGEGSAEESALREKLADALEKKNEEIERLRASLERRKVDVESLKNALEKAETDNARAMAQLSAVKRECENLRAELKVALENGRGSEQPSPRAVKESERGDYQEPAPTPKAKEEILRTIYLGKVNNRGVFVRADRKLSLGNTIYRLDTDDGFVGTFRVADNPTVSEMALLNPAELLAGGCSADDLMATEGRQSIVTDTPGTAIFENGCWKVLRKAKISYL